MRSGNCMFLLTFLYTLFTTLIAYGSIRIQSEGKSQVFRVPGRYSQETGFGIAPDLVAVYLGKGLSSLVTSAYGNFSHHWIHFWTLRWIDDLLGKFQWKEFDAFQVSLTGLGILVQCTDQDNGIPRYYLPSYHPGKHPRSGHPVCYNGSLQGLDSWKLILWSEIPGCKTRMCTRVI